MFCSQCGSKVNPADRYCPSCGHRIAFNQASSATSPPLSDSSSQPVINTEPTAINPQKKRMPFWFKSLIGLAVLALIGVTAGILFTESLVDVVDHQLTALRRHDINQAYRAYTSKDFQEATSLENFQRFVKAYPIFTTSQSAHFGQRSMDGHIGILKGNLTADDHQNVPVEYKLIKEDGKWKILSIRLLQPDATHPPQEIMQTDKLLDIVKAQLQAIEQRDSLAAYEKYASHEFKEATPPLDFEKFIKKYPILTQHHSVSFQNPIAKNGIWVIAAILKSQDQAAYVKYYLIYEDNEWKIWSMRILSPSEEEHLTTPKPEADFSSLPMHFSAIKLGSRIDENGVIIEPDTQFKSDVGTIYVNVEIANGVKDNAVYLNFQHLDSGSYIPAKATIEESGDVILLSSFSPPASGWPKGNYKLVVTSSGGLNKVVDFTIE